MRSSCRHARELSSTGARWKSESLLMRPAKRLDGISKNHLLPLEFPKLASLAHSSSRKLVACAYAYCYGAFLLVFFITNV